MRAEVTLRLRDRSVVHLGPGDLIGRVSSAALMLDDPSVSEAHALISLRRGELYMLALRRMVAVRGKPMSEVRLVEGLEIEISETVRVTVVEIVTPARILAVRAATMGTRPLGQVASVLVGPPPRLVNRLVPNADAHLWSSGNATWRLRIGDGAVRAIAAGDTIDVGKLRLTVCEVELAASEHPPTQQNHVVPLRLVAHYDSVEIHRAQQPVVTLGGVGARLISELVAFGGPVGWEVVARELWKDEADSAELRHRWDVLLGRVRTRLRGAGVRADLLNSDGSGQVQLLLYDGDQVVDRT